LIRRYNIMWSDILKSWYFKHWWTRQSSPWFDKKKYAVFNKNNLDEKFVKGHPHTSSKVKYSNFHKK
jgi:hypothetical protein